MNFLQMMNTGELPEVFPVQFLPFIWLLLPLLLIILALKGWSLWRAARMEQPVWFIALLIINTAGILPIVYLLLKNKEYNKNFAPKAKKKK